MTDEEFAEELRERVRRLNEFCNDHKPENVRIEWGTAPGYLVINSRSQDSFVSHLTAKMSKEL